MRKPREVTRKFDALSKREYDWIERICDGQGWIEALGSEGANLSKRRAQLRVHRYLSTPAVRERLVSQLLLRGAKDKAKEVIEFAAHLAVLRATDSGNATDLARGKLALSVIQGSARVTPRKGKGPAAPPMPASGRTLD